MPSEITVEIAGRIGEAMIGEAIRTITLAYAVSVADKINENKPPPPAPGAMQFVSDKQRRFVMANIREGKIKVPYVRGSTSNLNGSQALNRSYVVDLYGDEAVLSSGASYAPYVVGDKQARIHQGRWKTVTQSANDVHAEGTLDLIVQRALEAL